AQDLLRRHRGLEVDVTAIEIVADERGRPVVEGPWTTCETPAPVVSLAHADGVALAVAGLDGPIGVDVEPLRPLPETVVETAFAPEELALLGRLPPEAVDEWTVRCWCAKEAVAMALGTGFVRSPTEVRVELIDTREGRILATPTTPALGAPGTRLVVHTV